nr:bifunctional diguanylate cyclase/phosphodiesterase [uncultured Roseateles sp.]
MDNNALPAVPHLDVLEPGPPSAQGIYFLIAAALSVVLMAGMTLYYGLKDRQAVENNGLDAQVQAVLRQEARAEVFEDIARDTVILLIAQGAGFMIWRASGRKHLARTRRWQEQLARVASTDVATGLLNRAGLQGVLQTRLKEDRMQWLVLVGIDGLKAVNDLHGHRAGDAIIERVARRLMKVFEASSAMARTGGDEFGLLLPASLQEPLTESLMSLRASMGVPILHESLRLVPSVSVGAALLDHANTPSEALRMAHVALQAAKADGPGGLAIFDPSQDREACRIHRLRRDLIDAVERNELEVVYQPILDKEGRPVAAEALARWRHATLGPIAPDVFIPLAESSGCIHTLGLNVMRRVCADLAAMRADGVPIQRIAVNLSALQLREPDLVTALCAMVEEAGLMPGDIEIELTESAAMSEDGRAQRPLTDLYARGFSLAIDDFGTGHSSLSRLQRLPVKKLKIDRSFVRGADSPCGAVLLETMLTLAGRLGLRSVCEGVETLEQFELLRSKGCDLFQGYYFARPMSVDDLRAGIAKGSARPWPLRVPALQP